LLRHAQLNIAAMRYGSERDRAALDAVELHRRRQSRVVRHLAL
jgi:hypothetical protein